MNKIKKGDIVGRKSYNKDIIFIVKNIIKTTKGEIAILKGVVERVEADSKVEDLEIINKQIIKSSLKNIDQKLEYRIKKANTK